MRAIGWRWLRGPGLVLLGLACDNGDVSLGNDPLEADGSSGTPAQDAAAGSGGIGAGTGTGSGSGSPSGGSGGGTGATGGGAPAVDAGTQGPGDRDGGDPGLDGGPGGPGPDSGPGGPPCGSRGLRPCPSGQFCDFPPRAQCGESDAPGVCREQPSACTREYAPVCGCDGLTYGNRCTAASAGVSVRSNGGCGSGGGSGAVCGGFIGEGCPLGQYCNLAAGDGCNVADGQGRCEPQPQICTLEYDPVCGCDGLTYGNPCEAASLGMSVAHPGEC